MNRRSFLQAGAISGLTVLSSAAGRPAPDTGPVRLNANENPLGLSPRARRAVEQALGECRRYPFAETEALRHRIAELEGIPAEAVLLGCGSSELLRLAVDLLPPDSSLVITAEPTYEAVAHHALSLGIPVRRVPLAADFSHDLAAMERIAGDHSGPVLVYLCNPNNPTGTITPERAIRAWLDRAPPRVTLLVDEAYHHYASSPQYGSLLAEAPRRENLLVTRTFSKVYAMAGLRLGYLAGSPARVQVLADRTRLNVSGIAVVAARISLEDREFIARSVDTNRRGRELLAATLADLGLEAMPSETNFVMFAIPGEVAEFSRRMQQEGVLVGRPFPPLTRWCRVTIGLPEEMSRFCSLLRMFRERNWI
ncbi:MAG: histidinol-phosphate transaminase [Acidobacteriota bacterium]